MGSGSGSMNNGGGGGGGGGSRNASMVCRDNGTDLWLTLIPPHLVQSGSDGTVSTERSFDIPSVILSEESFGRGENERKRRVEELGREAGLEEAKITGGKKKFWFVCKGL